jgi:hypothetical protein
MKHGGTMITPGNTLEDFELSAELLFGMEDVVARGMYRISL